jgi:hypothetical protein
MEAAEGTGLLPLLPGPLASLREGDLCDRDGQLVALETIRQKQVCLLYFGAGWW